MKASEWIALLARGVEAYESHGDVFPRELGRELFDPRRGELAIRVLAKAWTYGRMLRAAAGAPYHRQVILDVAIARAGEELKDAAYALTGAL